MCKQNFGDSKSATTSNPRISAVKLEIERLRNLTLINILEAGEFDELKAVELDILKKSKVKYLLEES